MTEAVRCAAQTRAVALLSRAAEMCDDDTRLQRVVPYLLVGGPIPLESHFISLQDCVSSPF